MRTHGICVLLNAAPYTCVPLDVDERRRSPLLCKCVGYLYSQPPPVLSTSTLHPIFLFAGVVLDSPMDDPTTSVYLRNARRQIRHALLTGKEHDLYGAIYQIIGHRCHLATIKDHQRTALYCDPQGVLTFDLEVSRSGREGFNDPDYVPSVSSISESRTRSDDLEAVAEEVTTEEEEAEEEAGEEENPPGLPREVVRGQSNFRIENGRIGR